MTVGWGVPAKPTHYRARGPGQCGEQQPLALAGYATLRQHAARKPETQMRRMLGRRVGLGLGLAMLLLAGAAQAAGTLRIGLNEDPDVLDPARAGTFVGRIVFAAVCDKLVDTDAHNDFVPQLATAWSWSPDNLALTLTLRDGVRFHDGTPMDAEAVRANLDRYRSAPESVRKSELKPVSSVEVIDPHTIRLHLTQPYAPLVAVLADRAGMMISPKTLGSDVSQTLPCAGPFRLTERVAQDRIVVDRFPGYWNAGAIHLDRIVYQPIVDSTVRLVNLQAGQLDMLERLSPTDAAMVRNTPRLQLIGQTALAYYSLSINLAGNSPLKDPRIREALEASIDRATLNDVVMDGQFIPNNQFEAPGSRYWDAAHPVPRRDLARTKALLAAAGNPHPAFTLMVDNSSVQQQVGQVLQAMAGEAGFDVKLQTAEANAQVAAARAGDYDATVVIWSGRPDPDGNVAIWLQCDGFLNWGKYCNPAFDTLLAKARGVTDVPARQALYRQVVDVYLHDRPHIVLYHAKWLWALSARVSGFVPTPDGLIRPQGMSIAP
jgi:peptide/nickel transport system substrate-binding protein